MCGIVGAIANRSVENILVNGLKHLEYRGYDSAGLALINERDKLTRLRVTGKVEKLESALEQKPMHGHVGIAHTRWATHGKPCVENSHPHFSNDEIAIVHNGIIENHDSLRQACQQAGYVFTSETDSEIIAHLLHQHYQKTHDVLVALQKTVKLLRGAYAIAVISVHEPNSLYAVRSGSPLVVGVGVDEHFVASDPQALMQVTQQICYLEEDDVVKLTQSAFEVYDKQGKLCQRDVIQADLSHHSSDLGEYRHYMLKEIFEQVEATRATLSDRIQDGQIKIESLLEAEGVFDKVCNIQIVACGTSFHAGLVAKYWIEKFAKLPCQVEVASEFRYREKATPENSLLILISQSGETADLLAALRNIQPNEYLASLAICNVPMSTLCREADFVLMTKAGAEIGVASTKAFTAQLTVLAMLALLLSKNKLSEKIYLDMVEALRTLPSCVEKVLALDKTIEQLAGQFHDKDHTLFLGRGIQYPIAMEGALKLKEISYIHAEAYPAGELKHGPLALVDHNMPIITCAPDDALFDKLKSNLQEVRARGGQLIIFTDNAHAFKSEPGIEVLTLEAVPELLAPIIYTIPLQLLSYHVAIIKGTDVDKPRNLAKSVTVE